MTYNRDIHHRRSIRLKEYDYSQAGAYFVTICTQNRECAFGDIVGREMRLNDAGRMVDITWNDLPTHNDNILLDSFIIMPNHIHGIITIVGAGSKPAHVDVAHVDSGITYQPGKNRAGLSKDRAGLEPAPTNGTGLSEIVRQLKTFSTRRINQIRNSPGVPVWQRNYYERVIRNEHELHKIREYIINNPSNWETDENFM
ncbi:MAG: transposase [Nitrospirae bacterium]|nr:transposase [Nitrospirota bacterium]